MADDNHKIGILYIFGKGFSVLMDRLIPISRRRDEDMTDYVDQHAQLPYIGDESVRHAVMKSSKGRKNSITVRESNVQRARKILIYQQQREYNVNVLVQHEDVEKRKYVSREAELPILSEKVKSRIQAARKQSK